MSYENPQLPHDVNVSPDNPVAEFLWLLAAVVLLGAALFGTLYVSGGWLARFIPFGVELAWSHGDAADVTVPDPLEAEGDAAVRTYLQALLDRLAAGMDLPEGMIVEAHYADHEVPNAFALLGGRIVVTRGLYERMPSENALAMVLAHEIAHIRARDPISALGGVAAVQIVLVLLGRDAANLTPYIAYAVHAGYSRSAERRADALALDAVRRLYGHAGGTAATFEILRDYQEREGVNVPSLLSTHPADADRIALLEDAARDWDPARQPLRPLEVAPE